MSLTNALFSSVSGLEIASTQISVIGDNIANANTPGFKEKRAEFSAVLGQSITAGSGFAQIGAGALVNDIRTVFSQGVFETTQRNTDLGIGGRGFFVLDGSFGRTYSRAGNFGFDSDGFLTDPTNNRLQGFGIDPATGSSNGILGDIQVNLPLSPPKATGSITLGMNLGATDIVPIAGPFDPANSQATSSAREGITVFDSLVTFVVDPIAGVPAGEIQFNFKTANGAQQLQNVAFSMGPVAGSGSTSGIATTQFNQPAVTNLLSQDGFRPGTLSALEIDENGLLNGVFTNGVTASLSQIALANFGNVEGLTEVGRSQLIESVEFGAPVIAGANSGNLGSIRSSSLEKSNVDLAQQFVNLIVSQRAFQANTWTVSVANELLANLVALGH